MFPLFCLKYQSPQPIETVGAGVMGSFVGSGDGAGVGNGVGY